MNLVLTKNDKKARILIFTFSAIIFIAVSFLGKFKLDVSLGFDQHIFAKANAIINSIVAVLLVAGIISAKKRNYITHRNIMLTAMALSVLFLVSYILHHLLSGEAKFGDLDHNGLVDAAEKQAAGSLRYFYFALLGTHILLAGIVLPFILFTAYRALINENAAHRKLAKLTWPMWFYVAVTGPIVYLLISPYY
jgi:putative membrane protein